MRRGLWLLRAEQAGAVVSRPDAFEQGSIVM
jgi:hypothetical protein